MAIHKLAVILFVFCSVGAQRRFFLGHFESGQVLLPPPISKDFKNTSANTFEQNIDHFNVTDPSGTFSQRYFKNDEFYKDSGVFFLMVGGDSPILVNVMKSGEWYRLAEKYQASMYFLEHRYYGLSQPYENISTLNLRYLSSKHAIEDIALFITKINEEHNVTSASAKWVLFGGSYAGSLAVWSRLKYPHLIQGVVSSSAPLLSVLDFYEYFEVVTESLKTYDDQCATDVKTAMTDLSDYFSKKNVSAINSLFKFCGDLTAILNNSKDVTYFFVTIADIFAQAVQFNGMNLLGIPEVCNYMTDKNNGDSEVKRLSGLIRSLYIGDCFSLSYNSFVTDLKKTKYTEDGTLRQWLYQTCTEFGFYQTLTSENQIFGNQVPLSFYTNLCVDVFGSAFDSTVIQRGIEFSNIFDGEKDIAISNVVFVNGKVDPWYRLGIYETKEKDSPAFLISDTAHCADMNLYSESDSKEVKNVKKQIEKLVGQWLQVDKPTGASSIVFLNTFLMLLSIIFIVA